MLFLIIHNSLLLILSISLTALRPSVTIFIDNLFTDLKVKRWCSIILPLRMLILMDMISLVKHFWGVVIISRAHWKFMFKCLVVLLFIDVGFLHYLHLLLLMWFAVCLLDILVISISIVVVVDWQRLGRYSVHATLCAAQVVNLVL